MLCERKRRKSADDDNEEGEDPVWRDHDEAAVSTLCDVEPSFLIVFDVERGAFTYVKRGVLVC